MTVREAWFGVGFLSATTLWFLVGWLMVRSTRVTVWPKGISDGSER